MRIAMMLAAMFSIGACNRGSDPTSQPGESPTTTEGGSVSSEESTGSVAAGAFADVLEVQVSGDAGNYTFAVTLRSPDTGCDQYADWWEVLSEDGALVYRRILGHSHVDEQPFSRSGGPVNVAATDAVFVRAHMNPEGYGGVVLSGSVADGFVALPDGQAPPQLSVESEPPLPDGCAF